MHRSRHEERGRSFHALYGLHPPQFPKCSLTQKLSKSGPFGFYCPDWFTLPPLPLPAGRDGAESSHPLMKAWLYWLILRSSKSHSFT